MSIELGYILRLFRNINFSDLLKNVPSFLTFPFFAAFKPFFRYIESKSAPALVARLHSHLLVHFVSDGLFVLCSILEQALALQFD